MLIESVVEACHLPSVEGKLSQLKTSNSNAQDELVRSEKDEIICKVEIDKQTKKTDPALLSKNNSCFWNDGFDLYLTI